MFKLLYFFHSFPGLCASTPSSPPPPPKEMMDESLHLIVYSQKSHSLVPNQLENSVRLADLQKKIISVIAIAYFIKKIIY